MSTVSVRYMIDDVPAAIRFYTTLLGFTVEHDASPAVRGDLRTLIGVPIAAFLIAYLLAPRTRAAFRHRERAPT